MIHLNSNQEINPDITSAKKGWLVSKKHGLLFDTWLGSGTLMLGHECDSAGFQMEMLPGGMQFSNEYVELLSGLVDFEVGCLGFQTSGSAAVARAIRLARAITKREKVAVVGSFWHGSDNEFLFKKNKNQISSGVPISHQSEVVWFEDVEDFLNHKKLESFAALLVEPYQGADPSISMLNSLRINEKRIHMRDAGVLLVCDEIITGFRERYGSCSISRNCAPDIAIFGKALGLGFPVGLVVVNKLALDYMDVFPFWGGTFSSSPTQNKHIFNSLKSLACLDYNKIKVNNSAILRYLEQFTHKYGYEIKSGCLFSRVLKTNKVAGSRGFLTKDLEFEELKADLAKNGFFLASNALIFPSVYNIDNFRNNTIKG